MLPPISQLVRNVCKSTATSKLRIQPLKQLYPIPRQDGQSTLHSRRTSDPFGHFVVSLAYTMGYCSMGVVLLYLSNFAQRLFTRSTMAIKVSTDVFFDQCFLCGGLGCPKLWKLMGRIALIVKRRSFLLESHSFFCHSLNGLGRE